MSFGINAANLGTEGFELELARAGGEPLHIVLGQSGGLTGRYEQDAGRIGLRKISAHQFSLQKLALPLAQGVLRIEAPSILSALLVDAELGGGRPFEGQVTIGGAVAQLVYERGPLTARAALRAERAVFERSPLGGQRGELDSAEVGSLHVELEGQAVLHVERLTLRGVRFALEHDGRLSLACLAARAEAVVIEQAGQCYQLGQLALPRGLELQGDVLRWPELTLERLEAALPVLPGRRPPPAARPAAGAERAELDLPLLDHLQGLLAFDLLLDVRVPILPDRRATHSIRVPIEQGTINFKQLEGCLAKLEDALFDFEVTDEGLIFELDPIPGISVDNVTLVSWPLGAREHALAKTQQKVRLRRLLDYRLSPKLAGSGGSPRSDGRSPLRRLHVGNIETVLQLGGPTALSLPGLGTLRLGTPEQPAARELRLSGQLEHAPGQPPAATELRLDAQELRLGASLLDAAGRRVEVERLGVRRVEAARLGLLGLSPRSVSLTAEGLHLGGVELRGWLGTRAGA